MPERPQMLRLYVSHERTGDGYRNVFVLSQTGETTTVYVLDQLKAVPVPTTSLAKAKPVPYRPKVVRSNLLKRARLYRKYGPRVPRHATVQLLRMLGAGRATIEETVNAPPLPEVVQARAQRLERAEQRERLTGISTAIRERIEAQPLERPRHAQPRRRARHVHPDQLAVGL
jgi:hypothetical protein